MTLEPVGSIGPSLDLAPLIASEMARLRHALEYASPNALGRSTDSPVDSEAAIHAARRCIKMLRATLRLLGKPKDDPARKALDDALRTLADALATSRDLHVAAQTADVLRSDLGGRKRREAKALRAGLDQLAREWLDKANAIERHRRIKGDAPALEALESMTQGLRTTIPVTEFSANAERTYRKARRLLKSAQRGGDADALHVARGEVVRHQLQCKAVRTITGKGKNRLKRLDTLRNALGEHHDLAVMEILVGETPHAEALSGPLKTLVRKRQQALRDKCRPIANELFSGPAGKFRDRLDKRLAQALGEGPGRARAEPSGAPKAADG